VELDDDEGDFAHAFLLLLPERLQSSLAAANCFRLSFFLLLVALDQTLERNLPFQQFMQLVKLGLHVGQLALTHRSQLFCLRRVVEVGRTVGHAQNAVSVVRWDALLVEGLRPR